MRLNYKHNKHTRKKVGNALKGQIPWNKEMAGKYSVEMRERMGRKRVLKDKICICGKIYRPKTSIQKNCSQECSLKNRPKKGQLKPCLKCEKLVWVMPHRFKSKRIFCSQICFITHLKDNSFRLNGTQRKDEQNRVIQNIS